MTSGAKKAGARLEMFYQKAFRGTMSTKISIGNYSIS